MLQEQGPVTWKLEMIGMPRDEADRLIRVCKDDSKILGIEMDPFIIGCALMRERGPFENSVLGQHERAVFTLPEEKA